MDINYILKVKDAKAADIQKTLQAAGIKVTSITEVFKEQGEETVSAEAWSLKVYMTEAFLPHDNCRKTTFSTDNYQV